MNTITLEKSLNKKCPYTLTKGFIVNFEDMKFLLKAYDKNIPSYMSCNHKVIIKDGKIIVCNGYRIHMIDCTENKDENFLIDTEYNGQYEVIINNKKTIVLQQAEKGEGIFNADEFFFNKMNNFQSSDGENIEIKFEKDSMDISIEYARIIKAMPENECINYDFFSDLFYKDSIYTAKIPADEMDAVYFENCNKYAALMPIRMSSED